MTEPQSLAILRARDWAGVPKSPGVYWWYFPRTELKQLRIAEFCDLSGLQFRLAADDKVCLYHGMAKNLANRVEWHAAQKLTRKCLQSGFLSTFRFTLLALNDFNYFDGSDQIDAYFDRLSVRWQAANSREDADVLEQSELRGKYHYALNIQGNKHAELAAYIQHLKCVRADYKRRFLQLSDQFT